MTINLFEGRDYGVAMIGAKVLPEGDYRYQATQDDINYRIAKQTERTIDCMLSQMQGGNIQCSTK